MNWNPQFTELVLKFAAKFPIERNGNEDNCRIWIYKLAQQFEHNFPVFGKFGSKRQGSGYPQTKDVVAIKNTNGFFGWDLVLGAGSTLAEINSNPSTIDLTGQEFIPVNAYDWLGEANPVPTPDPTPNPAITLEKVYDVCLQIQTKLNEHLR